MVQLIQIRFLRHSASFGALGLQDYITALKELLSETEMAKENERIEA